MNNNYKNRDKPNIQNEFMGEIVAIIDDVVEVKDELGQTHSFKIIGFDVPAEFGELEDLEKAEKLEVGDKVRINLEKGRLTSIQKLIKNN